MASNYVSDGNTLTFFAPANLKGGVPVLINNLIVVPLHGAAKDSPVVGRLGGVWRVQATDGLKLGQSVSLLGETLVAPDTDKAVPFGKLMSDAAGGYAEALLIQQ